jgi:hypothetical protein
MNESQDCVATSLALTDKEASLRSSFLERFLRISIALLSDRSGRLLEDDLSALSIPSPIKAAESGHLGITHHAHMNPSHFHILPAILYLIHIKVAENIPRM